MNKRITITSFLLVVLLSSVSAQFKVVEKSAKKAPVWYQKMVDTYNNSRYIEDAKKQLAILNGDASADTSSDSSSVSEDSENSDNSNRYDNSQDNGDNGDSDNSDNTEDNE